MIQSSTQMIIDALRVLSRDIHCEDGVATAVIAEAADRLDALRLTAEERKAVETAMKAYGEDNTDPECAAIETTLFRLLQRMK